MGPQNTGIITNYRKMEANELRIGNILSKGLKSGNGRRNDSKVTAADILSIYVETGSFNYEPIPLTTDILLKCGATKVKGDSIQYRVGNRLLILRNNCYYDYATEVKLEFVHKFQNFIYALTEKELEIK